jgi:hypothetical protein
MIIFIPEARNQKEQKLRLSSSAYKTWLTKQGDTVGISNLRRGDPANKKRGEDPDAVYYHPMIELYKDKTRVNFHFLGATQEERVALDRWLKGFNRDKLGYVRIVDHRRKK